MHDVSYDILSALTSTIILTVTFLLLYVIEKKRYLLYWFISWGGFSSALFLRFIGALGFEHVILRELSVVCMYFNSTFILLGVLSFIGRDRVLKVFTQLMSLGILLIIIHVITGSHFIVGTAVFVISAAIYMYTGVKLYINTRYLGYGGRIAGITIFLWGLHKADYPLVKGIDWFQPLGYHLAIALTLISAVGIVLMHFEKVKIDNSAEEDIFKNIAETSHDIVFIVKYLPVMRLEYISPPVYKITGYTTEEVIADKALQDNIVLDYMVKAHGIRNVADVKSLQANTHTVRVKDDKSIMLQYNYSDYYTIDGKLEKSIGFITDITERVLSLDHVIDRQDWYEALFQKSQNIQLLVDAQTGAIVDANQKFVSTYGYSIAELRGMNLSELFAGQSDYMQFMESGKFSLASETCRHIKRDGDIINVTISSSPVKFDNSFYVYVSIVDISKEIQVSTELEEMTNQHSAILKSLSEGVIGTDVDGRIFFMNSFAATLLGVEEETAQVNFYDILLNDKDGGGDLLIDGKPELILLDDLDFATTYRQHMISSDGRIVPVVMTIRMLNNIGSSQKFVVVFRDITKELEHEESMMGQIKENEVLLKEVHHRVKNNLQIICSLLSLQMDSLENSDAVKYLTSSIARIKSMALIHELLYQSKGLNAISIKSYIEKLIFDISCTLAFEDDIKFRTNIDDIYISLDKAVPCGLVVTELITNSIKHAFEMSDREKVIEISFNVGEDGSILCVRDSGVGMPEGGTDDSSLGLTVVHSLVKQLKGTITFKNSDGLSAEIDLPKEFIQI